MAQASAQASREQYRTDIEKLGASAVPSWLKAIRESGAKAFDETDFPSHKQEEWRFTNVTPIVRTPFRSVLDAETAVGRDRIESYLFDEPDWVQLVFVDGIFQSQLSQLQTLPKGTRVQSIAEAMANGDTIVRRHLDKCIDHTSAFITLNSAFLQDGAFFYVPEGTALDVPVHFLFVSTGTHEKAAYPRNLFVLGASSQATVVESYRALSGDAPYFTNAVTEIVLEDNARLNSHKWVDEGAGGYHLCTRKVHQGRDTYFKSSAVTTGGRIVRNELRVLLDGEGGECDLHGLYLNDGDRLIDNALNIEHARSHCRSRMAYKGILDGASSAVFTGKVFVRKYSQRTDSDQLNNNLLLSNDATIDTKPQLEIFADDVKCTHGATVGSFPDELIFYFRSRGMNEDLARGILTYGFAGEVANAIELSPLRERLDKYIFNLYSPR